MPTPLIGDSIIQVIIETNLNTQRLLNVLHYQVDSVGALDYNVALNALLGTLQSPGDVVETLSNCQSEDAQIRRISAQPVYPARLAIISGVLAIDGGVAQPALPQNTSLVVTKRSDLATRYGTGSIHIPGIPTTFVSNGFITGAANAAMVLFADAASAPKLAGGNTYTPVLWNLATPGRVTVWDRYVIQETSRVMRRRTVGVGI